MQDYTQLANATRRFDHIIEATGLGTWEYNIQTQELIYNEHWANMLGYNLLELAPINVALWFNLVHPEDLGPAGKCFRDCVDGITNVYETEIRLKHKNGSWVWVLDKGKVVSYTVDGKPEWVVGSNQDITARKTKELLLEQDKGLLKKTKDLALIGSWEYHVETKIVIWSAVTKKIHEVDPNFDPLFDQCIGFYTEGKDRDAIVSCLKISAERGESFDQEFQIITAKGNLKWVRVIATPVFENDICVRIYGLFQDVTEKNEAIRKLAVQEEQFRQTFDYAANGMALVNLDGKWLRVNTSICEMLGYSSEELLSISFQDITHPDDLGADLELLQEMLDEKRKSYTMEKRYFHKNGDVIWVSLSVSIVKNKIGQPLYFVSQLNNITQEKMLELRLIESNKRMQGILDASTQVGIIETDHLGVIQVFNRGAENLLGYSESELVRKETPGIFHLPKEMKTRAKDIKELTGRTLKGFDLMTYHLKESKFETQDWTYIRKDESQFFVQVTITAVRDADEKILGYLLVFFDITPLKEAEGEITSLLSVTQQQNKRLLNFAHIVSHNLRSHAGNISMLLDLIGEESPELTETDYFPILNEASKNLMSTIGNLSEVVQNNSMRGDEHSELSLCDYINRCIGNLRAYILESDALITNTVDPGVKVFAIPAYLESAILNLLSNAIKYRSVKRRLEINISCTVDSRYAALKISDNGSGIDLNKNSESLFGMYKTFHGNTDARGIGLFITKNQIETMGGKIEVTSEVDKGTTFTLSFPCDK